MYPIILCSWISVGLFLERLFSLRRSRIIPSSLLRKVEELLDSGNFERAIWLCIEHDSVISRLFLVAIKNFTRNKEEIKAIIEEAGERETVSLSRFVSVLGTIVSITPLLGLLGTVLGMIRVFEVISTRGVGEAAYLAGGISEALFTTAAGLTVAIPTLIFYRYLQARVNNLLVEIEARCLKVVDILREKKETV